MLINTECKVQRETIREPMAAQGLEHVHVEGHSAANAERFSEPSQSARRHRRRIRRMQSLGRPIGGWRITTW